MPIKAKRDKKRDLTTVKVTGAITYEEIMTALAAFYAGETTNNVLFDLTEAQENQLSLDQMDEIVSFQPRFNGKRDSGKTGIIVKDGHLWGLSRMLAKESNGLGARHTVMVFSNAEAAHRWLEDC